MKTFDGYKKRALTDVYALLAGGGHKPLSEFSMAHTHPYLPLSGGTVTGTLTLANSSVNKGTDTTELFRVYSSTGYKNGLSIFSIDNKTYINAKPYGSGTANALYLRTYNSGAVDALILAANGNATFIGSVTASSFIGNASTATKLTSSAGNTALPVYFSDGKPVACTASSIFSNLSNSGNNISITVAGQNRTLTVGYATNTDKVDGYHAESFVKKHTEYNFNSNGTTPYNYVWLCRIGNTTGYSGVALTLDVNSRYHKHYQINMLISTGQYPYSSSSISINKSDGAPNVYYVRTSNGSDVGYDYYDIYVTCSAWNQGGYKIIHTNANGNLSFTNKCTLVDSIPSGAVTVSLMYSSVNYANSAGNADTIDGYHANGLLTALSNSNNGVSITVGGTTKSISNINVNYANSAGNADTLDSLHANSFVRSYNSQAISGDLKGNYIGMSTSSGITSDWWHILCGAWNDEFRWNSQLALPTQNRNGVYYRSGLDNNTTWGAWIKLLDVNNYSSTLDSRYYTESEVNNLLNAKLNRQNLSYGTWNPRGYNLAADYHYNGGDLSISENGGKMYVSIDGWFYQNEGQYRVLDTSDVAGLKDNLTVHQYLSNTDTTWWPLIWGGSSHSNTGNSTGTVYKSYDKLSWQTSSQTLYATHLRTTDLNTQTALFHPDNDSTLKIYSGRITDAKSDGNICLQTSIDGTDGQSHTYPTQYGARCNLVLQPRGGQVYIGTNPDGGNTTYKLYVNSKIFSNGGFVKNGSSDSYVLLGGGGHKVISDFATSSHTHDDRYYTKAESNVKYITDITTSINKLTFTKNGSNINRDITVNVVYSQGNLTNISDKDNTTKASPGLLIYNSYSQTIGTNSYSSVLSINTGGTIQIAGNWGDDQARNLYWRSQSDRAIASYPWKSWRTILDSENYNNYAPTKTGGGASGTWGISITGNAATASKLGTSTVGATNIPIYLNGGTPTSVNLNSTANNLINNLTEGTSTPTDADYYVAQYVGGGTTTTTYHRRPHSALYAYIKSKAEGTWNISINGNAATATNADKVDGYHASSLWRSDGATWNPGANVSLNASANNQEWSFDIRRNGYTGCYWHVWDSERNSMLKVNADNGKVYAPYNFVGNLEGNASSANRASYLSGHGVSPNNSHPGHGARVFYSWNIGQVGNDTVGYSNGITIGSNPGDTAYGFQIVQNMWDDRTYTRRYNGGWQSWKTLAWTSDIPTKSSWNYDDVYSKLGHTHDDRYYTESEINSKLGAYLPLSGGTMTGNITYTGKGTSYIGNGANDAANGVGGALNNLVISSWWGISFTTSCSGQTYTNKNAVSINCRNGYVYANTFVGAFSGNASSATSASKWTTARTLTLTGSVTGNVSIDGSSNVTLTTTTNHTHNWTNIEGKPSTFTPSSHTHDDRYYTESEVNNLLSNKLNTSNFNWTNLSGKLVAGNEFNIVNAGFNSSIWFNHSPINDRSKTASINGYHFGNGAGGYTSIKASGFIKNGSSSSYVLLGDGGHKAISDFATSGHIHTLTLASDTGANPVALVHGGKYKLTVGGSSIIFTLPTDNNTNPANYYWANVKVSATSSTTTSPTFNTCYTNSWFRSYGKTGWYSESYGGGWYMNDTTWIRTWNSKGIYTDIGTIYNLGHAWLAYNSGSKVGIGTTSPSSKLHVVGDGRITGSLYAEDVNANSAVYTSDVYSDYINVNYDIIADNNITADGVIQATHFYENSDIRYKKILKNLSINSNTIANLPLFDFEWIENNTIGTGTSAQAVQQILPNIVSGTDKLTLDYGVLGTIAGITACKELVIQKSELQQLKEKVKQLEDKLRKYKNTL